MEHTFQFKYLICVLDESGTDRAKCCRKVVGAVRSLLNARGLKRECIRLLHEGLFASLLMYRSETMVLREKERAMIRCFQFTIGQP